ncbi:MAG: OB-fold nucleic acid binding domain-containing protein, partial [Fimbriimonadaceae bacterium]|nr:OB-fold nucleic acid binding domain-containing protein [Fimbriimonadaceae bacterium]
LVFADNANRLKQAGQESLFGDGAETESLTYPIVDEMPAPDRSEILQMEKDTMGIYISDHPLRGYDFILRQQVTHDCATLAEAEEPVKVTVAGVLAQVSKTVSQRTGARICRFTLEDFTGQIQGFLYGDQVNKFDDLLVKDKVVKISGRMKFDDRQGATERRAELQVYEIKDLPKPTHLNMGDDSSEGAIWIRIAAATQSQLLRFKEVVEKHPGNNEVVIEFDDQASIPPIVLLNRVSAGDEVLRELRISLERCRVAFVPRGELL